MRVLVVTTIFPNAENPGAAPYVRRQTAALAKRAEIEVLALLRWSPASRLVRRFSYWGKDFSRVPTEEVIDGLRVRHPRFLHLPRVGLPLAAASHALSLFPALASRRHAFDVVFATWAYPDGVSAILLGRLLGLPVVVQVLGSDVNVVAALPSPRRQLRWALPSARGVIAVSQPLGEAMIELGAPPRCTHVIPTGVDLEVFRVRDRAQARAALGAPGDGHLILFIGRLHAPKGIFELFRAFDELRHGEEPTRLVVIGDGPARAELEARAESSGGRILLTGELPPERVAEWLAAADVLALPSHAEGTPNVVLEALAAGRKVVATRVGGIPALVRSALHGELVEPGDVPALRRALKRVLSEPYEASDVRRAADLFDWDENARRVLEVLERARLPTGGAESAR